MTPPEFEPTTFDLVMQYLNKLHHRTPTIYVYPIFNHELQNILSGSHDGTVFRIPVFLSKVYRLYYKQSKTFENWTCFPAQATRP